MPQDTATLRRAFAAQADDGTPQRVDDTRVWQAVRGELSQEERHALIEELPHNPALAESWRVAMALSQELDGESEDVATMISTAIEPSATEAPSVTAPTPEKVIRPTVWNRGWAAGLAVAAALLVVVGVSQGPWSQGPWSQGPSNLDGEAPVYRQVDGEQITSQLDESVALARENFTLSWSAIEGARYRVRVLGPDLQVVVETELLDAAQYRVAPEDLGEISGGTQLLWQVDARLEEGRTVSSATFFATLAEDP